MNELLTPQEVLQALIDGESVESKEVDSDEWLAFNERFAIKYLYEGDIIFRIKPKVQEMITIGDVSFPKPYQGEMEYNQVYYLSALDFRSMCDTTRWEDGTNDHMLMNRGLVHLTKDNAIAHAKALINLSGGENE